MKTKLTFSEKYGFDIENLSQEQLDMIIKGLVAYSTDVLRDYHRTDSNDKYKEYERVVELYNAVKTLED